jgi:adenine-specific DNA-methyltransferase
MISAIAEEHAQREALRQSMQVRLDAVNSSAERNRLGQFATPYDLAVDIARYVGSLILRENAEINFADPSIGTGSFFSAALKVFGSERMKSALGIELDPAFANAAEELWADAGLKILQGDFTRVMTRSPQLYKPNVILANPPYVRHHHLCKEDKERLQRLALSLTGVNVSGLAGLYVYFVLLATAWMADDGIAAWLVPSEFMDVNYGVALKKFLIESVTLVRIHRFSAADIQFGDALVSSAVVVFRKTPPPSRHSVEFTFGGTVADPDARDVVSLLALRNSRKWTRYPNHFSNDRHSRHCDEGTTIGDLFRVQRGIATGCNKFFILDRSEATRLRLPTRYLRPILPSPRHLKTTVILSNSDGYPVADSQLCVIDCDLSEKNVQARHPALWQYLKTADALGVRDGYLIGKRNPWYKQEQREAAPFLCTYMGRGSGDKRPFRFIWNRSKAIGTNLYLMLYPRAGLARMLSKYPERESEVHKLLSEVTGHELRGEGRVYGGGLNKIEPSELARVSAVPFVERWPELKSDGQQQEELFSEASG